MKKSSEKRKTCPHDRRSYQCIECYEIKKENGEPTPGWHQICNKLFQNCKCELNEDLKQLYKCKLLQLKKDRIDKNKTNVLEQVEFIECMLAGIDKKSDSGKLSKRCEELEQMLLKSILTKSQYDYKDRLDLCRHLKLLSATRYAEMWIEEDKFCAAANVGEKRKLDEKNVINASVSASAAKTPKIVQQGLNGGSNGGSNGDSNGGFNESVVPK